MFTILLKDLEAILLNVVNEKVDNSINTARAPVITWQHLFGEAQPANIVRQREQSGVFWLTMCFR